MKVNFSTRCGTNRHDICETLNPWQSKLDKRKTILSEFPSALVRPAVIRLERARGPKRSGPLFDSLANCLDPLASCDLLEGRDVISLPVNIIF